MADCRSDADAVERIGVIELRDATSDSEEAAWIIAESIEPAPDKWPPSPP